MSDYPAEITQFHATLHSLSGIDQVWSGIDGLDGLGPAEVCSVMLGHLPVGTLLRTQGGLPGESLLQFEFEIDGTPESLVSLEFLSWFVRDQARSGKTIQLRTFALPPQLDAHGQRARTLKFHIDYFFVLPERALEPVLAMVADLHRSLELAIRLYQMPVR